MSAASFIYMVGTKIGPTLDGDEVKQGKRPPRRAPKRAAGTNKNGDGNKTKKVVFASYTDDEECRRRDEERAKREALAQKIACRRKRFNKLGDLITCLEEHLSNHCPHVIKSNLAVAKLHPMHPFNPDSPIENYGHWMEYAGNERNYDGFPCYEDAKKMVEAQNPSSYNMVDMIVILLAIFSFFIMAWRSGVISPSQSLSVDSVDVNLSSGLEGFLFSAASVGVLALATRVSKLSKELVLTQNFVTVFKAVLLMNFLTWPAKVEASPTGTHVVQWTGELVPWPAFVVVTAVVVFYYVFWFADGLVKEAMAKHETEYLKTSFNGIHSMVYVVAGSWLVKITLGIYMESTLWRFGRQVVPTWSCATDSSALCKLIILVSIYLWCYGNKGVRRTSSHEERTGLLTMGFVIPFWGIAVLAVGSLLHLLWPLASIPVAQALDFNPPLSFGLILRVIAILSSVWIVSY
jgi:hypothetical protein